MWRGTQTEGDDRLMRGSKDPQATMLAFVDLEERVPHDHPVRIIKAYIATA